MMPVSPDERAHTREQVVSSRRVIVKIGSNVLVGDGPAPVDTHVFAKLVQELALLDGPERSMTLVTSGAIAVARRELGIEKAPGGEPLAEKQALAAIGQPLLMTRYEEEFRRNGKRSAQVLVSPENIGERERFLNARNTLRALDGMTDIIPVINENDTTSTTEIRFGDNDSLAAQCVSMVDADVLIILSDIDSLYDADPRNNPAARKVEVVYADDPQLDEVAAPPDPNGPGSGGMVTKIRAARIAASRGVPTIIAAGRRPDVLQEILRGEAVGTLFVPRERQPARKAWLRFASMPAGVLHVDDGAARAIRTGGRSLLAVGVVRVDGEFSAGAPVEICGPSGATLARGMVNYPSREIAQIAGRPSSEIQSLIGYQNGDAVVHRDDLALVGETD